MDAIPRGLVATEGDRPRGNRLLHSLRPEEQSLLARQIKHVELLRGTVLESIGEMTEKVHFPHNGALSSLLQTMQDGTSVEVAAVGSEGVVGSMAALGSGMALTQVVVQMSGMFARIAMGPFRAAVQERSDLRDRMIRYNEFLVAQMQQSIGCNALHDVESRLCRWLLQTQDRMDSNVLPFTQEFVGQMLGVRRTTITLVARMLQSADMIRCGRAKIEILDRGALQRAACECYPASRRHMNRFLADDP
jgi:CRP-like cAMP-binding protein